MPNVATPSHSTGIARHASQAAMTGSRALTSHARRHYKERYAGRYRYAPLVFAFDGFLLALAGALLVFDLFWFLHATFSPVPGLAVAFQTSPLAASEAVPIQVEIRATDGRVHEGVRLKWTMPDWVEIIRSEPAVGSDGLVPIGLVRPNDVRSVRVIVRVRAEVGDEVPISVSIRQLDPLGNERVLEATEIHDVAEASLQVKPLLDAHRIVSRALVPYVVQNASKLPIESASLHLIRSEGAPDAHLEGGTADAPIGRLNPGEQHLVWVDVGSISGDRVALELELRDGPQPVSVSLQEFAVVPDPGTVHLIAPLEQDAGTASVRVRATGTGAVLLVHPDGEFPNGSGYELRSVAEGETHVTFPITPDGEAARWSAVPISGVGEDAVVGRALSDLQGVPVSAAARFYSVSGDQIGVGPNPPVAGQSTRYWIAWTVGPVGGELQDVELTAELPAGVDATGNSVSPIDGASFSSEGRTVTWRVSKLELPGDSVATFAFEVIVTPSEDSIGKVLPLVGTVILHATDEVSGSRIEMTAPGDDTRLRFDENATTDGKVVR